jgi:hypothetical protein
MLSDLLAANRRLLEDIMSRVRRIDAELGQRGAPSRTLDGVYSTGAPSWHGEVSEPRLGTRDDPARAARASSEPKTAGRSAR